MRKKLSPINLGMAALKIGAAGICVGIGAAHVLQHLPKALRAAPHGARLAAKNFRSHHILWDRPDGSSPVPSSYVIVGAIAAHHGLKHAVEPLTPSLRFMRHATELVRSCRDI